MRPSMKRMLGFGVVAATGYAVWRAFEARRSASNVTWQPQPFPYPPVPRAAEPAAALGTDTPPTTEAAPGTAPDAATVEWVEPDDSGCPATHPVKAKLSSGIFHVPGGASYERTRPDRCYPSPAAAEADGLRAAKA